MIDFPMMYNPFGFLYNISNTTVAKQVNL